MDSNEVEIEQSSTELKHLGFLKETAVKFLVVLSNIYDFVKENSGDLKTAVVSAENTVVSIVGPVYEKLKDFPEQIILFIDDKFDKYAPSLAKKLVVKLQSLINKTTPLLQKLLTTTQTAVTPLITTTVSLVQNLLRTTKSLLQNLLRTAKSAPLVRKAQTLLQKGLTTTQTLIQSSAPLVATTHSLLQNSLDTTKSRVEGIPLMGNVAQSLITNPTDLAKSLVPDTILQKGPDLANQTLDTTRSLVGGIPLVGNVAQSLITNPTDLANQIVNTTNSIVNENPILGAVNSAAQNIVKEAQATGTKAALQSAYTSFKVVGIPAIAEFWYKVNKYPSVAALSELMLPVVEYVSDWYNKVIIYMDGKGYSMFGYLPSVPIDEMKAAYKLVKTSMDGLSAVGDPFGPNPEY